jgi:hypothetical protein
VEVLNDTSLRKHLIGRTGCGATGNCPTWVFEVNGHSIQTILDTLQDSDDGTFRLIGIMPTRTNGYRDLILAQHE